MNTMSPSRSCAWWVMPTVSVPSASTRTHSWLGVYLRSAGMLMFAPDNQGRPRMCGLTVFLDQCFADAHERIFHDFGFQFLVADLDFDFFAGGYAERDARERDGLLQCRREGAGGDLAVAVLGVDFLVAAEHALVEQQEAGELLRHFARL